MQVSLCVATLSDRLDPKVAKLNLVVMALKFDRHRFRGFFFSRTCMAG